jgi:hypothetical protein
MSDAQDRLFEIYLAYKTAKDNRSDDLKAATTAEHVNDILKNIDRLHSSYLAAIDTNLATTGPDIETAFATAKAASKAVNDARKAVTDRIDVIKKTTTLADNIAALVKKLAS